VSACAGTAFGMRIASREPIMGLAPGGDGPLLSIELEAEPPDRGSELLERLAPDGSVYASIHHHEVNGYRIFFDGYGACTVAPDGSSISCRPAPEAEPWEWQQFLFGQGVPFAALLRGIEPLHASAVAIGGRAVAFAGGTGAGKSSIALELVARGADFVSDDVLALTLHGGETVCHGGLRLANVREGALRTRAEQGLPPFGEVAGASDESVRALVRAGRGSAPLGALYFLARGPRHERVRFEAGVQPTWLLGHTFNAVIRTPDRLARQLDLAARITASVPVYRVTAPERLPACDLAPLVEAHALAEIAQRSLFQP